MISSYRQWVILTDLYKDNKLNSPNDTIIDHEQVYLVHAARFWYYATK